MGGSCCDKDCENEHNDLYIAWMNKMRHFPKLHPQHCHDKCGCYNLKHWELCQNDNYYNNKKHQTILSN